LNRIGSVFEAFSFADANPQVLNILSFEFLDLLIFIFLPKKNKKFAVLLKLFLN
jgi:hypothetical protein